MTHVSVKLPAGIGITREFVLDKKTGRISVSYITATVSVGQFQASMMQFSVEDLFDLLEKLWGLKLRKSLEDTPVLPEILKKLETP